MLTTGSATLGWESATCWAHPTQTKPKVKKRKKPTSPNPFTKQKATTKEKLARRGPGHRTLTLQTSRQGARGKKQDNTGERGDSLKGNSVSSLAEGRGRGERAGKERYPKSMQNGRKHKAKHKLYTGMASGPLKNETYTGKTSVRGGSHKGDNCSRRPQGKEQGEGREGVSKVTAGAAVCLPLTSVTKDDWCWRLIIMAVEIPPPD